MENYNEQKQIKDDILQAIKSGQVKMKPRWKFILGGILFGVGVALITLVLLYLVSFVISALRETGILFAPAFGSRGVFTFIMSLPWLLIGLSFVFLVVLEIMVRHYQFGHHKPLLYSVLGILVIVMAGGIITAPWHTGIFKANNLPIIGQFYRNFEIQEFSGIHRGDVIQLIPVGFVLEDPQGATSTVIITPETRVSPGPNVRRGDMVIVFGDIDMNLIQAYGIKVVKPDCLFCF